MKKIGLFFAICLVSLLISLVSATDLQLSKKISNTGTITGTIPTIIPGSLGKVTKPNVVISNLNGNVTVSNISQYDLMFAFSYIVENRGIKGVGPIKTFVSTLDSTDNENVQFSVDGRPRASPLSFNISPGGTYPVSGIDYVKKSNGWSPGAWEKLFANIEINTTKLDEKFVKLTLP